MDLAKVKSELQDLRNQFIEGLISYEEYRNKVLDVLAEAQDFAFVTLVTQISQ